ncbi:hypothetical protein C0992_004331, partial [Termitomyces sp. T32_za158]
SSSKGQYVGVLVGEEAPVLLGAEFGPGPCIPWQWSTAPYHLPSILQVLLSTPTLRSPPLHPRILQLLKRTPAEAHQGGRAAAMLLAHPKSCQFVLHVAHHFVHVQ